MTKTPEFIRVKRRRDEDSVQALLIDEDKKVKRAKYIFKLQKTVNQNSYEDEKEAETPLLKLSDEDNRHFVLEQHKRKRDQESDNEIEPELNKTTDHTDQIPSEITEMVDNYLKLHKDQGSKDINIGSIKKKPSKKHYFSQIATLPSNDYVYDIYHLEKVPETEIIDYNSKDNVGFVKIVNKYMDLLPDRDEDENSQIRSDDEDSNDENYYQNDYPEDEDDDRSILFGSEGENIAEDDDLNKSQQIGEIVIPSNVEEWEENKSGGPTNDNGDDYTSLFNQFQNSSDLLLSINTGKAVDVDIDSTQREYYEESEELDAMSSGEDETERNMFFATDEDDPLAQHRDKIFGQLQKMINKK